MRMVSPTCSTPAGGGVAAAPAQCGGGLGLGVAGTQQGVEVLLGEVQLPRAREWRLRAWREGT